jgi:DNA-3-methyladenine glycosylase II
MKRSRWTGGWWKLNRMSGRTSTEFVFDPAEATAALSRADKKLAKIIRRAGPFTLRPEKMQSPFEALLRAIVYQQLSGKAAATIYSRVEKLYPDRKSVRPEELLESPDADLRGAGLSRAKVAAAKDLAAKTLDGTVPTLARLRKMADTEILERLVQVRGIGIWSVEMLLIFRLGRPDVLPISDLGVRRGFMLTYGHAEMPAPKHLLEQGERWRPFRSVASWYLWRAVDLHRAK